MMVLCPFHHDQATKGALSQEGQREWKLRPFNVEKGHTSGLLVLNQPERGIALSSSVYAFGWFIISCDLESLLVVRIVEGELLLSITAYDQDDHLLAEIWDNEWIVGSADVWDLEADWQKLSIRARSDDVRVRIDATENPPRLEGRLLKNGYTVEMSKVSVRLHRESKLVAHLLEVALVGMHIAAFSGPEPRVGFIPSGEFSEGRFLQGSPETGAYEKGLATYERLRKAKAKSAPPFD